ncbi:MAG: hypothetical protein K2W82_07260 [Candidatus Obscuribacterales bacterium]|nr:hypothetical protein [Candidatus Obscuribacterales bacterium]
MKKQKSRLSALLAAALICHVPTLAKAQPAAPEKKNESSASLKGKYLLAEPKIDVPAADTKEALTRLPRPGDSPESLPVAPSFNQVGKELPKPAPGLTGVQEPKDKFPTVGQLESLMFGHSSPSLAVDNRLDKLEVSIFQKSYKDLDTEARIRRLREVIVGGAGDELLGASSVAPAPFSATSPTPYGRPDYKPGAYADADPTEPRAGGLVFQNFSHFDLKQEMSIPELEQFGLMVLNDLRAQEGLDPLAWDELSYKVAKEHTQELTERNLVSHFNVKGENPDVRYSKAGGMSALEEGLILFTSANKLKANRELIVKILEAMEGRQDDHESFFSKHATSFALSLRWTADRSRLVCCTEVVTNHVQVEPIPLEVTLGDKIELKGSVSDGYRFQKITLAWEGPITAMPDNGEESDEAMPYFPPLDYEAHAAKSERDWEKGMRVLQIAGITAAIAGGFFIPPVALAAPLIAASAGVSRPKPVSEIPIKGGVKTDGSSFSHKVTIGNDNKEGIYYLTIWGTIDSEQEAVPLSRRAIIARKGMSVGETKQDGHEKKGKKKHKEPDS